MNPHLVTEDTVSCFPLRRTTSAWQPRAEHCELRSMARTPNILQSHKLSSHHPRYVGVCKAKKTRKAMPVPRCTRKRGCNNEPQSPKKEEHNAHHSLSISNMQNEHLGGAGSWRLQNLAGTAQVLESDWTRLESWLWNFLAVWYCTMHSTSLSFRFFFVRCSCPFYGVDVWAEPHPSGTQYTMGLISRGKRRGLQSEWHCVTLME